MRPKGQDLTARIWLSIYIHISSDGNEVIGSSANNNGYGAVISSASDGNIINSTKLINNSKTETIEAGNIICAEGEIADKVYLILDGKVKVFKKDGNGNETELATIEKGNLFGEMALFDKGFRCASVRTIEPCQFLIFEGNKFLELLLG